MNSLQFLQHDTMKNISLIILISLSFMGKAQDTLTLRVPMIGGKEIVLFNNDTFVFRSNLCGSTSLSYGTYKKSIFGLKLYTDSSLCPKPHVVEIMNDRDDDTLMILFFDLIDNTNRTFFGTVQIGGIKQKSFGDTILISKKHFLNDSLIIETNKTKKAFRIDTSSSIIECYLALNTFGYSCGSLDFLKLKKTKGGYMQKSISYDDNRDKPWKKGKRRVTKEVFRVSEE